MRKILYGGALTGLEEERAIIKSIRKSRKTKNWQAGEEAALFEKELADYIGVKHSVLTSSGSCAGLLALSALELPRDSEVIIPATTFPTIFNIILQCGLRPVVVDSKIGTYNLDPNEIETAIGPKTKAVIVVHALGNPVDMVKIMKIAKKHNLYVLEDNCDGLGSSLGGRYLGSFGHVSFTSLHAAHIVSMGVGGVVFTNDLSLATRVKTYRDWGRQATTTKKQRYASLPKDYNPRFVYEKIGYNFQILELQAAMGRVQLRKIEKTKKARQDNFNYLYRKLAQFPALILPNFNPKASICWFAFPLTTIARDRGELTKFLEERGIETRSLFSGNILRHPAYNGLKVKNFGLFDCNAIVEDSFWISCHPRLSKADLKYIVKTFESYYAQVK